MRAGPACLTSSVAVLRMNTSCMLSRCFEIPVMYENAMPSALPHAVVEDEVIIHTVAQAVREIPCVVNAVATGLRRKR